MLPITEWAIIADASAARIIESSSIKSRVSMTGAAFGMLGFPACAL